MCTLVHYDFIRLFFISSRLTSRRSLRRGPEERAEPAPTEVRDEGKSRATDIVPTFAPLSKRGLGLASHLCISAFRLAKADSMSVVDPLLHLGSYWVRMPIHIFERLPCFTHLPNTIDMLQLQHVDIKHIRNLIEQRELFDAQGLHGNDGVKGKIEPPVDQG
ncbi:uncharacterized protein LOC104444685 [Eucalyptus grandis]|uniref:uncharacterized protein LOC104444685 n=1 Tax=Eucalyptus grandis TaxID=71139 RepID=UPI00192EA227|nr:uncharacterized protein LOC104444685 [Eucalyptus grandis]